MDMDSFLCCSVVEYDFSLLLYDRICLCIAIEFALKPLALTRFHCWLTKI